MKSPHLRALGAALLATLLFGGCATSPAPQQRPAEATPIASQGVLPLAADAPRLVPLQGALNVRSFEGLRGKSGPIPAGSFLRAADLDRLTAADRDTLAARGVVLDLDLRTAEEAVSAVDTLAGDDRFRYVRISLLGTEKLDLVNLPDNLGVAYVESLAANQPQFRQVFETIAAQQDGTVLFHCTAGKDRTGMISAILLSPAGVPRSEIVHNYSISAHYLEPMMKQNPKLVEMVRQNPKIVALMGTPPEAMEAFLDALDRQHGGARTYLGRIGVSDADVQRLMVRLGQSR